MTAPEYNPPPQNAPYPPGPGGPQGQPGGPQYGMPPGPPQGQYGGMPPGPPQGQYGMPPAPPQKNLKKRRIISLTILAILVIVGIVFGIKAAKSNPDAAKPGDCVSRGSAEDIKVVDCAGTKAAYKVVGKVEDKTQVQFDLSTASICKPFTGAKSAFWKGKVGEAGYVLCLAPIG